MSWTVEYLDVCGTWRHVEEWDDVAAPLARQQDYTMPFVLPFPSPVSAATCHYADTYRFVFDGLRGPGVDGIQLSEVRALPARSPARATCAPPCRRFCRFPRERALALPPNFAPRRPPPALTALACAQIKLFDPTGAEITGLSAANPGGIMSNKANVASNLVDGSTASKWFDEAIVGTGTSVVVLTLPAPAEVASYELYTGHDVPKRDPSSWRLERVTPGGEVELMSTVRNANPPAARQAAYDRRVASAAAAAGAAVAAARPRAAARIHRHQFVFTAAREREGVPPPPLPLGDQALPIRWLSDLCRERHQPGGHADRLRGAGQPDRRPRHDQVARHERRPRDHEHDRRDLDDDLVGGAPPHADGRAGRAVRAVHRARRPVVRPQVLELWAHRVRAAALRPAPAAPRRRPRAHPAAAAASPL